MKKLVLLVLFLPYILLAQGLVVELDHDSFGCSDDTLTPNAFNFYARISNTDSEPYCNAIVTLRLTGASGIAIISGANPRNIGTIGAGHTNIVSWRLKADEAAYGESFQAMVEIRSDRDILLLDSPDGYAHSSMDIMGYDYTLVSPTDFLSIDLADFEILYVGWHMSITTNSALNYRASDIEAWWRDGGNILVSAQIERYRLGWLPLEVDYTPKDLEEISVLNPNHYILCGADGVGGGNDLTADRLSDWVISSHCYFTSWDEDYLTLTTVDYTSLPSMLVANYAYDDDEGRIVLVGQEFETHIPRPYTGPEGTWPDTLMRRVFDYLSYPNTIYKSIIEVDIINCGVKDREPPTAQLTIPTPGIISACVEQEVVIAVEDSSPIDTSSIIVQVAGQTFTPDSHQLTYADGEIIFLPEPGFYDPNSEINIELTDIEDIYGNGISSPITWSFYSDFTAPVIEDIIPVPYSFVIAETPDIAFKLYDLSTELNNLTLTMEGRTFDLISPSVEWVDSIFTLHTAAAGLSFEHNDTTRICIHSEDKPDVCSPNVLDTCWDIYFSMNGPVMHILYPDTGTISSCPDDDMKILLEHDKPLDFATVELKLDTITFTSESLQLLLHKDTLVFSSLRSVFPAGGKIDAELLSAHDALGNPLQNPSGWHFTLDFSTPAFRANYSEYTTLSPKYDQLDIDIYEALSAINHSVTRLAIGSVELPVDSSIGYLSGAADSLKLALNISEIRPCIAGKDTVKIYLTVEDNPDSCGPNILDTCLTYLIDISPPIASLIYPPDNAISACPHQIIKIFVREPAIPNGVLRDKLRLNIEGDEYELDDTELTMHADTLTFEPCTAWNDGDTIDIVLFGLEDSLGNLQDSVYHWRFIAALSPPECTPLSPLPYEIINALEPEIKFTLNDSISGVNYDALRLVVNGVCCSSAIEIEGDTVIYDIAADPLLSFAGGEYIELCVYFEDTPDLCAPNTDSLCWSFSISSEGPVAMPISPPDSTISSCRDGAVIFVLFDADGIKDSSVLVQVNSDTFSYADDNISIANDTLIIRPNTGTWDKNATISVTPLQVYDRLGNALEIPAPSITFFTDFSPPRILAINPPGGDTLDSLCSTISFELYDSIAGLALNSSKVYLLGTELSVNFDAIAFNLCSLDINTLDMDSMVVALDLYDKAELCGANDTSYSFVYYFERRAPEAHLVAPAEDKIFACELLEIVLVLNDVSGVVDSSISLSVNEHYLSLGSRNVTYEDETLKIVLDSLSAWGDETLTVTLQKAYDNFGNSIDTSLYTWKFLLDFDRPFINYHTPSEGSIVMTQRPRIAFIPADFTSGVELDTTLIEIDGIELSLAAPDVSISGDTVLINTGSAIFNFGENDTVDVCVTLFDRSDTCGPNSSISCWRFYIEMLQPADDTIKTIMLLPTNNSISACSLQEVKIFLESLTELAFDSTVLTVQGASFTLGRPELSQAGDTLIFIPPDNFYEHRRAVEVKVDGLSNEAGFTLENELAGTFKVDFTPPYVQPDERLRTGVITPSDDYLSFSIHDSIAPIARASINIEVNGNDIENFSLEPIAGSPSDLEVLLPIDEGVIIWDSITISVTFSDAVSYCKANADSAVWVLFTRTPGACKARPNPFTPNGDGINDVIVFDYPQMYERDATIKIFDAYNHLVVEKILFKVSRKSEFDGRIWRAEDKELSAGLYIYVIEVDNKVKCSGTFTIVK